MKVTTVMVVHAVGLGVHHSVFVKGSAASASSDSGKSAFLHWMRWDFSEDTKLATRLGLFGILMAFGHSVLAMSGEESLAQVNREIEHPKLKNLKRAAIVIAIYSFIFTGVAHCWR